MAYPTTKRFIKDLTDNVQAFIFFVPIPAGEMAGGFVVATVTATDGTEVQSHTDIFTYTGVNKAGVFTTDITNSGANDSISVSAGTLTVVWAITIGGPTGMTLGVTANTSLTPTDMKISVVVIPHFKGAEFIQ